MSENVFENDLNDLNDLNGAAAQAMPETKESTPGKKTEEEPNTVVGALYEGVSIVVSAIMIIAVVFTFAFRLVGVQGSSMNDTLQDGDWVLVTPYYTEPKYGDIVIGTKETAAEKTLIKRVIAVSGDEVIVDEHDDVTVNGVALKEDAYTLKNGERHGNLTYPVTVPDDCVMMMGDNRLGSWDSRFSEIGFQEYDYLLGKVQFRLSKDFNVYKTFEIENGK